MAKDKPPANHAEKPKWTRWREYAKAAGVKMAPVLPALKKHAKAAVVMTTAVLAAMLAAVALLNGVAHFWPGARDSIQNAVLFVTAIVVAWYTLETARLRKETQNMVEEAQQSRLQSEAASEVDAELRLHQLIQEHFSILERVGTRADFETAVGKAIYNAGDPTKCLLGSKANGADATPKKDDDATLSISKTLTAIQDHVVTREGLAALERHLRSDNQASGRMVNTEKSLATCELLLRLKHGRCRNTALIAAKHLPAYDLLKESFLKFIVLQKLLTWDVDYGETYLAYLEQKDDDPVEPRDQIREIRRAMKPVT